jgi:hypothetical protein
VPPPEEDVVVVGIDVVEAPGVEVVVVLGVDVVEVVLVVVDVPVFEALTTGCPKA